MKCLKSWSPKAAFLQKRSRYNFEIIFLKNNAVTSKALMQCIALSGSVSIHAFCRSAFLYCFVAVLWMHIIFLFTTCRQDGGLDFGGNESVWNSYSASSKAHTWISGTVVTEEWKFLHPYSLICCFRGQFIPWFQFLVDTCFPSLSFF